MKYQYNPLLTEGYKLKTFLLDPSGGNLSREAANTEIESTPKSIIQQKAKIKIFLFILFISIRIHKFSFS